MTWRDFKTAVEAAGVQDTDPLDWIDLTPACAPGWRLQVHRHPATGRVIIDDVWEGEAHDAHVG